MKKGKLDQDKLFSQLGLSTQNNENLQKLQKLFNQQQQCNNNNSKQNHQNKQPALKNNKSNGNELQKSQVSSLQMNQNDLQFQTNKQNQQQQQNSDHSTNQNKNRNKQNEKLIAIVKVNLNKYSTFFQRKGVKEICIFENSNLEQLSLEFCQQNGLTQSKQVQMVLDFLQKSVQFTSNNKNMKEEVMFDSESENNNSEEKQNLQQTKKNGHCLTDRVISKQQQLSANNVDTVVSNLEQKILQKKKPSQFNYKLQKSDSKNIINQNNKSNTNVLEKVFEKQSKQIQEEKQLNENAAPKSSLPAQNAGERLYKEALVQQRRKQDQMKHQVQLQKENEEKDDKIRENQVKMNENSEKLLKNHFRLKSKDWPAEYKRKIQQREDDRRRNLKKEQEKEVQECTFQPQISSQSQKMTQNRFELQMIGDQNFKNNKNSLTQSQSERKLKGQKSQKQNLVFENLYSEGKRRAQKQEGEELANQNLSESNQKQLTRHESEQKIKSFIQRQGQFASTQRENLKQLQNLAKKIDFSTGERLFHPQVNCNNGQEEKGEMESEEERQKRLAILYSDRKRIREEKERIAKKNDIERTETIFTGRESTNLVEKQRNKLANHYFEMMDSDQDGAISRDAIQLDSISKTEIKILVPLLQQIEQESIVLERETFEMGFVNFFAGLSLFDKKTLLESSGFGNSDIKTKSKNELENQSAAGDCLFKPQINETSRKIDQQSQYYENYCSKFGSDDELNNKNNYLRSSFMSYNSSCYNNNNSNNFQSQNYIRSGGNKVLQSNQSGMFQSGNGNLPFHHQQTGSDFSTDIVSLHNNQNFTCQQQLLQQELQSKEPVSYQTNADLNRLSKGEFNLQQQQYQSENYYH